MAFKWRICFSILFLFLALSFEIKANPVTFKNGTMLETLIMGGRQDFDGSYTLTRNFSLGGKYSRIAYQNQHTSLFWPQLNYLLKRWNLQEGQGNIYLTGGIGVSDYNNQQSFMGGVGGQADFETRRIYTSIKGESALSTNNPNFNMLEGKAGIAPYLADYNQLSTWLIGQVLYQPYRTTDAVVLAPAIRFFYSNLFLEAGSSIDGFWFVNFMTHL